MNQLPLPSGIEPILSERTRQVEAEGWTDEIDDSHTENQLIFGAICYLMHATGSDTSFELWPWAFSWWRPSDLATRDLEKAGALIAAEIARRQRKGANGH